MTRENLRDLSLRLADRVPSTLRELLRGLELSQDALDGKALDDLGNVQGALVTSLLRIVFLFHAEARGLIGLDPSASPRRVLERLRKEAADEPAALHERSDAWRGIVEGFDEVRARYEPTPSDHLFGERGRLLEQASLSDATVHRVLTSLACVRDEDGDEVLVDFADLDIEQLGTFYEATMGFSVERLREPSLLVGMRKAGALPVDVIIGLDTFFSKRGHERISHLEGLGLFLSPAAKRKAEAAAGIDQLVLAIGSASITAGPLPPGALVLRRTEARRRAGSHYTSRALAEQAVNATLEPLFRKLGPDLTPARILELKVCDPAMGSGAFLLASSRILGDRLVSAWERHGMPTLPGDITKEAHARRLVASQCLYGVDKDRLAVELARLSLWLEAGTNDMPFSFADHALRHGDSLAGSMLELWERSDEQPPAFDWQRELADVFSREGASGFDAIVGNPPWISYAGRAAQPLEPARRAFYAREFEAFSGYRNLQGLFVERSAKLLRGGGRLGLVVPSSMSEQAGYAPTRLAHDRLCEVDVALPDLGEDSFDGVVQPCMILLSTKRAKALPLRETGPWPIERRDLDALSHDIIAKMNRPPLPAHLFGERGIQTSGSDVRDMPSAATERHTVPLRAGSDIAPFRRRPPSFHADPARLGSRLRAKEEWAAVRVLIRQTARLPMAALSDGLPFRNSILAGFEDDAHPATFLVAYLNSSPIRWLHYMRHRDARQGIPQVKIGHLRVTPEPPDPKLVVTLSRLGEELSERNVGLDESAREQIDELVADAFDLSRDERERLRSWAKTIR